MSTAQMLEVIGAPVIAGLLGLVGVVITVWAQDRGERRRGWQDLESSRRQLELMAAWLEINDRLAARDRGVEVPATLADDLRRAYHQAHRGGDTLVERRRRLSGERVLAMVLPPRSPRGRAAGFWRTVFFGYLSVAGTSALLLLVLMMSSPGLYESVGEYIGGTVVFVLLAFTVVGVGPLSVFRSLSIGADRRARGVQGEQADAGQRAGRPSRRPGPPVAVPVAVQPPGPPGPSGPPGPRHDHRVAPPPPVTARPEAVVPAGHRPPDYVPGG